MKTIPVEPVTKTKDSGSTLGALPLFIGGVSLVIVIIGFALWHFFEWNTLWILLLSLTIVSIWRFTPEGFFSGIFSKKSSTDTTAATTTVKVVGKKFPWYVALFYSALALLVLTFAVYVAYATYHRVKTEKNDGFGGTIEKTKEMVARTYSYDPYPDIQTLEAGHVYKLEAGHKYKWYGAKHWEPTNNQPPIKMEWDKVGSFYVMIPPRDCEIVFSEKKQ
jgi:hypothetical protein